MAFKNIKKFYKAIQDAVAKKVNKVFKKKTPRTVIAIQNTITQALIDSETYKSLTKGSLRGHMGFPKGTEYERVDYVVNTLVDSIGYKLKTFRYKNREPSGELVISFLPNIISDLYNNELAIVTTEKGEDLPWLEWLLEGGSSPLITGYRIGFINGVSNPKKVAAIAKHSRSGLALMFKNGGSAWYVPVEHQGTIDDNWITRAIESNSLKIRDAIKKGLQ